MNIFLVLIVASFILLLLPLTIKKFNINPKVMLMWFLGLFLFITEANFRNRGLDDTSIDFQILLRIAVWAGVTAFSALYFRRVVSILFSVNARYLTFYCILCLLTTAISPIPLYTFVNATIQILFLIFAATLAINLSINQICLPIFYMSLAFHIISLALIPIFPELTIMQFWGLEEIGGQRITGLSGSANGYGQMAGLAIVTTQYLRKKNVIKRNIYITSMLLFIGCILASWSRTSIFITLIGVMFIEKDIFKKYKSTIILIGFIMIFSYLLVYDFDDILLKFSRNGSIDEIFTFTGRTDIWSAVWSESLKSPIFGYGYASTKMLLPQIFETDWGWSTVTAHNMFLQSLFATGLLGILLISMTLLIFFMICRRVNDGMLNYFLFLTIINGLFESGAIGPIPNKLTFIFFLSFFVAIKMHRISLTQE